MSTVDTNVPPSAPQASTERTIWLLLFVLGGLGLLYQGCFSERGIARIYVKPARVDAENRPLAWTEVKPAAPGQAPVGQGVVFSPVRTLGLWVSAIITLAIFSYLYRDNVVYKLAESIIVGVSAGYYFVAGFWDSIVAQLMVELVPDLTRAWAIPSLEAGKTVDLTYLIPLGLSLLLFARLIPGGAWLARWPLGFVVGTFAGLRLVSYLDADFVTQIRSTIVPLIVMQDGEFKFWSSLRNVGLLLSTLSCLTYFFFSLPHTGATGRVARVGVWVLMITFGASFAFTVMGRITLLTMRFEFLFIDWLQLVER